MFPERSESLLFLNKINVMKQKGGFNNHNEYWTVDSLVYLK